MANEVGRTLPLASDASRKTAMNATLDYVLNHTTIKRDFATMAKLSGVDLSDFEKHVLSNLAVYFAGYAIAEFQANQNGETLLDWKANDAYEQENN